jgi:hypothetical protein
MVPFRRELNAGDGGVDFVGRDFALGRFPAQVLADFGQGFFEEGLVEIAEEDGKARASEDVGDAAAHGAGADYGYYAVIGPRLI